MITVVGGTGRLGRLVTAELAMRGDTVRVVARHPAELPPGIGFVAADMRDDSKVEEAVKGSTVVISAINGLDPAAGQSPAEVDRDGNLRLIAATRAVGAALVLVSIIGAGADSAIEVARMKAAAEHAARNTPGLEWTIVRAGLFAELWRDVLRQAAGRSARPVVFGRGTNPINVVSVVDVAHAVTRAAVDPSLRGQVIDVGGPRNVTMNELAEWATGSSRPRHIPRGALRVGAAIAQPMRPAVARLMRQALAMDTVYLAFDPAAALAQYPWLEAHDVVGSSH